MIIWYGFIPSLLTTFVGIFYVGYQIMAFKTSPLFDDAPQSFMFQLLTTILNFIQNNFDISIPLIVVAVIILLLFLLLPVLLDASMIQVISRHYHNQKIGLGEGVRYGVLRFLPLFEFSLLMRTFSFISISAEAAFIIRNLGPNVFQGLIPVFIVVAVVALILHILFTFAEYYIVIDETSVSSAIVKSCTLVIINIQQTFMLAILMLIIAIRILIQIVLVIIIPVAIITGLTYFASISLPEYGLIIIGVFSFLLLLFAAYLAAVVHVFSVAVWTHTFIDFTSEELTNARGTRIDEFAE